MAAFSLVRQHNYSGARILEQSSIPGSCAWGSGWAHSARSPMLHLLNHTSPNRCCSSFRARCCNGISHAVGEVSDCADDAGAGGLSGRPLGSGRAAALRIFISEFALLRRGLRRALAAAMGWSCALTVPRITSTACCTAPLDGGALAESPAAGRWAARALPWLSLCRTDDSIPARTSDRGIVTDSGHESPCRG